MLGTTPFRPAPSAPARRPAHRPLWAAGLLLLSIAAATPAAAEVRADHDKSRDFAAYENFAFGTISELPSAELRELLRATVAAELAAGGLERAATDADLVANIWAVDGEGTWLDVDSALGYGLLGWPGWSDWGPTTVNVRRLEPGSVMVDLYDRAAERPVWRGLAEDLLIKIPKKQAKLEKKVGKVLGELFEAFPPG